MKKKHTARNILLILLGIVVLGVGSVFLLLNVNGVKYTAQQQQWSEEIRSYIESTEILTGTKFVVYDSRSDKYATHLLPAGDAAKTVEEIGAVIWMDYGFNGTTIRTELESRIVNYTSPEASVNLYASVWLDSPLTVSLNTVLPDSEKMSYVIRSARRVMENQAKYLEVGPYLAKGHEAAGNKAVSFDVNEGVYCGAYLTSSLEFEHPEEIRYIVRYDLHETTLNDRYGASHTNVSFRAEELYVEIYDIANDRIVSQKLFLPDTPDSVQATVHSSGYVEAEYNRLLTLDPDDVRRWIDAVI